MTIGPIQHQAETLILGARRKIERRTFLWSVNITDSISSRDRFWGLAAAIVSISAVGAGFGHSIPLFSVLLDRFGASDFLIGANTGFAAIAAVVAAPIYPKLIHKLGLKVFMLVCLVALIVPYFIIYFIGDNFALWFALRFVLSFGAGGLFIGSEVWINALANPEKRGQIIGIYGTCLALGFALGPLTLEFTKYDGFLPFAAGIAIFSLAAIPLAIARRPNLAVAEEGEKSTKFLALIVLAPVTFAAAAASAGFEDTLFMFLPIFAIESGLGEAAASRTVMAYAIGIVSFQYLIGRYADKIGATRMLYLCAWGAVAGALMYPLAQDSLYLLYPALAFWGGTMGGVYTVGLTIVGHRFQGPELAAANTGYVFMFGVGAIIGPTMAGLVRDTTGELGLNLFFIILLTLYASVCVWRRNLTAP